MCTQEFPWPPSLACLMTSSSSTTTIRRVTPHGDREWPAPVASSLGHQAIGQQQGCRRTILPSVPTRCIARPQGTGTCPTAHAAHDRNVGDATLPLTAAADTLPPTRCFLQLGSGTPRARAGQGWEVCTGQAPRTLGGQVLGLVCDSCFSCTLSQSAGGEVSALSHPGGRRNLRPASL